MVDEVGDLIAEALAFVAQHEGYFARGFVAEELVVAVGGQAEAGDVVGFERGKYLVDGELKAGEAQGGAG